MGLEGATVSLRGNTATLSRFEAALRRLPRVLAQQVAAAAAPEITKFAKASFDASADPFGAPWDPGVEGQRITLRKGGALEKQIRYVAIGTRLRVALGVPYAKYQIGRRPVFPRAGLVLPIDYVRTLEQFIARTSTDVLGGRA